MSKVFPTIDGFVGYGEGLEAQLRSDEPWDSGHPLVQERPELFTGGKPAPAQAPAMAQDGTVDDETRAALIAAGWTPPADEIPQEPAAPPAKAAPAKAVKAAAKSAPAKVEGSP